MKINYAHYSKNVTNLGPYNRNILWLQGCNFDCEGCVAPEHKMGEGYFIESKELATILCDGDIEGLTISGGEPFEQADALAELLVEIAQIRPLGIIVFTGYTYEALKKRAQNESGVSKALECIDLLIDGPYIKERDIGERLRGSNNQEFNFISVHYAKELIEEYNSRKREMVIRQDNGDIMMIGIPDAKQLRFWRNIKKYIKNIINGDI